MPYKDATLRRKTVATSMRRSRYYLAAVRAATPKALEAERNRTLEAMKPANDLHAEILALPAGQGLRAARKAEYEALYARCLDARDAALAAYARLRAEVIEEAMRLSSTRGKAVPGGA